MIMMFFIGEVGLESQHTQSDLIETLSNYHGHDGHEQVTPIGVIQEIYASDQPFLLTMFVIFTSTEYNNLSLINIKTSNV